MLQSIRGNKRLLLRKKFELGEKGEVCILISRSEILFANGKDSTFLRKHISLCNFLNSLSCADFIE